MIKRRFHLLLLCFLCTCYMTRSQQPEQTINVQFDCLAWKDANTKDLKYRSNGQWIPLRISRAFRTGPYHYHGPNPIIFAREEILADGSKELKPVAKAQINPQFPQVLLLFTKSNSSQTSPEELKVVSIDDSVEAFPYGSYRLFNLSNNEIGCILADKTFKLEPMKSTIITPDVEGEVDVRIHFSSKIDDQWVPSVNTRWLYREDARRLVFITQDDSTDRPLLQIKTISQFLKTN